MESLVQFTLDFEKIPTKEVKGEVVYLKSHPEFGFGKIISATKTGLTVYFLSVGKELLIDHSDPNLQYVSSNLKALYTKEERKFEMNLSLKALELKLTHAFDKLSSLSNSRTRLLPHQIESTYIVVNSLKPRFILADEVGLGKTIEAALIMKELIFRNAYKRVLIVTPSPLLVQWKQELKNKFNEDFTIIKRKNFISDDENNWQNFNHVITSVDFIKNPRYAEDILKKKWDIVIFDEAHRLRRDYSKITRAYVFAEKVSKKCECLLLLTATPFRGKLEELFYLMHLVDPNILGPYHTFINDYVVGSKADLKEKISKVLLRRRKVEIGGFTKRFAKTVKIDLSDAERQFYEETTEYVRREYNLAMNTKNRAIGFVMIVFQKLLDSSHVALLSALTRRKFMIESRMHKFKLKAEELEDWDLDETEGVEDFISGLDDSAHIELQNVRRELLSLNRLILLGKSIKEDRKSMKLKETLYRLRKEGHKKFIIFTQFRSTQDYLYSILDDFKVVLFHGSLSADGKEEAIQKFKEDFEILICTEAGGEGRNLQFSNVLFNYDLPWSPLKIEQRIGRIHRFGQKKDVYIFNFASKDTVAERILEVLTNKIKLFEDSIGASDALLGTIEDELDFNSSFMRFITGSKTKEEIEIEMDLRIKVAEQGFNKLNDLVTPKLIDFNLQDYYNHTLSERQYNNTHLEEFLISFAKYFPNEFGSNLQINPENNRQYLIQNGKEVKHGTFFSEDALVNDSLEFLAFGHPLVEKSIQYLIDTKSGFARTYFSYPEYESKIFFVFLVEFQFSLKRTEIFYLEYDSSIDMVSELNTIPEFIQDNVLAANINLSENPLRVESGFIRCYEKLLNIVETRKDELVKNTLSIFKKEEFKIEVTSQKVIRQLQEKLNRQEAQEKWDPRPERKSVINRTKNEIMKVREDYEREIRKVRNGSTIHSRIELFQVYIGC
ncbi:MAG TPA: SNF2-related protein [Leptospiraceae bacterium]|nr:SNF2-related protein [Leptospiraceae bacterium]HMW05519.1 SNF2-related protein [Leptospiraceae bacterium]HMX32454.1 SNF2-related protein [Leptospiraceae bacterium]HMY31029.1 SNF2-related protein [Leptospiraceae bacterium]HMZ65063.1 SNF2-related protein [Leptospiraceae bacterium]